MDGWRLLRCVRKGSSLSFPRLQRTKVSSTYPQCRLRLRLLEERLSTTLTSTDYEVFTTLTDEYATKTYDAVKAKQRQKFQRLRQERRKPPATARDTRNVVNLSQRTLNDDEQSVLSLGLNYAVAPRRVPSMDIIAAVESGLRSIRSPNLPPEAADEIRSRIGQIIRQSDKKPEGNLTRQQTTALRELQRDASITILPADKGNATVVMDRDVMTKRSAPYWKMTRTPNSDVIQPRGLKQTSRRL